MLFPPPHTFLSYPPWTYSPKVDDENTTSAKTEGKTRSKNQRNRGFLGYFLVLGYIGGYTSPWTRYKENHEE